MEGGIVFTSTAHFRMTEKVYMDHFMGYSFHQRSSCTDPMGTKGQSEIVRPVVRAGAIACSVLAHLKFYVFGRGEVPAAEGLTFVEHGVGGP